MPVKLRVIVPVWGDRYVGETFAGIVLPSLLAPGNLPCLAERFDCEFVLLTETRFFSFFETLDAFVALRRLMAVELRPLDDILCVTNYSVPLTLALFRGFIDLGARATETYLVFLNADFALADGSYRSLVKRIEQGETAIFAPSLRVNSEDVIPMLRQRQHPTEHYIAVPPREMARMALRHLHTMPRTKIVNRPFVHPSRIDQFYWQIGEDTLIGFQFPIAMVCVKPQVAPPSEAPSYFDYCSGPVLVPTARRCVFDDSDEFFMMELQSKDTGEQSLLPGWPTIETIAADLSLWTTADQRDLGSYLLRFHGCDLPDLGEAERMARAHHRELMRRLSATPQSYLDHPFWVAAYKLYGEAYREKSSRPISTAQHQEARGWSRVHAGLTALRQIGQRLIGRFPDIGIAHPLWPTHHDTIARLMRYGRSAKGGIYLVLPAASLFSRLAQRLPGSKALPYPAKLAALPWSDDRSALLFIEIDKDDLETAARVASYLRMLAPGSRALIFFGNERSDALLRDSPRAGRFINSLIPDRATGDALFYGGLFDHLAHPLVQRLVTAFFSHRLLPLFLSGIAILALMPVCVLARRVRRGRISRLPGRYASAMLLDLELG
jgi:hypothetical protein